MKLSILLSTCCLLFITGTKCNAQSAKTLDSLIKVCQQKGDSVNVVRAFIRRVDDYGLDTSFWGRMGMNNIIYNYLLPDRRRLIWKKGARYMKGIVSFDSRKISKSAYAGQLDTYARLLYKLGKRRQALKYESEAAELDTSDREIAETLEKMKKGAPLK